LGDQKNNELRGAAQAFSWESQQHILHKFSSYFVCVRHEPSFQIQLKKNGFFIFRNFARFCSDSWKDSILIGPYW